MEETDVRHIQVLEFPKQLLWTDRDLEYFLEEMPCEASRMNNDIYDAFIKEVEVGKDYSPEEAFNLAYYECVRISLAKYPESKDIFDILEMDIQHNQNHVDYGFTDLIMNMVWAMLHSTNTTCRFADKLHSYLVNSRKLRYSFRVFFTPNDHIHMVYPYEEKEEPRYNWIFTPCPKDMNYNWTNGEWRKLTVGYKEHLIKELLMLWPEDQRDYIRKCIMEEKSSQMNNFTNYCKKMGSAEEKTHAEDGSSKEKGNKDGIDYTYLNDPSRYEPQEPYELFDSKGETITYETAKGINERRLNPYEVDWMEVTLFDEDLVSRLLEKIDSELIMDVAQAIDDEESSFIREGGQYIITSHSYGTGQESAEQYSWVKDSSANVEAVSIAKEVLDARKKYDEYEEKMKNYRRGRNGHSELADADTHLSEEMLLQEISALKGQINHLMQDKDALKQKLENCEPEKAFNAQTGNPCFTSRQMGILLTAVGRLTEKENPPGKTTLGDIVERISGYKSTTSSANMRGTMPKADIDAVVAAIESKFPNLAAEVSKV